MGKAIKTGRDNALETRKAQGKITANILQIQIHVKSQNAASINLKIPQFKSQSQA